MHRIFALDQKYNALILSGVSTPFDGVWLAKGRSHTSTSNTYQYYYCEMIESFLNFKFKYDEPGFKVRLDANETEKQKKQCI